MAFELLDVKMSGMESGSSGRLLHSKAQCSDVRKQLFATKHGDELVMMMERFKCVKKVEVPFVRSVLLPNHCVLATDTTEANVAMLYGPLQFQCS